MYLFRKTVIIYLSSKTLTLLVYIMQGWFAFLCILDRCDVKNRTVHYDELLVEMQFPQDIAISTTSTIFT